MDDLDSDSPKPERWWSIPHISVMEALHQWPFLRQLKAERRFRYAFAVASAIFIVIVGSLPKVWIITPKNTYPILRASGLDFLEAWIFRTFAEAREREDHRVEAWQYWRQACAHYPTSPSLLRGALENTLRLPTRNYTYFSDGTTKAFSLVALDRTNPASLYCSARTFSHFRFYEAVINLTAAASETNVSLRTLRTQSFLWLGNSEAYTRERQRLPPEVLNRELELFDCAQTAAWSSDPVQAHAALTQLQKASADQQAERRVSALRLRLLAASERTNVGEFEKTLQLLHDEREDEPLQHVQWWRLLEAENRRDQAVAEARKAELLPISSTELLGVAHAFEHLGLTDRAIDYLGRYATDIHANTEAWLHYADLVIAARRWDDLRQIALDLRNSPATHGELAGYSHFLEGLALRATGADDESNLHFRKAAELSIPLPNLALLVARKLLELHAGKSALEIAVQQEEPLAKSPEYWRFLVELAADSKDAALLLRAARTSYALTPADPVAVNTLASALIVNETEPELLLKLTAGLAERYPDSLAANVNYAMALIANQRLDEAARTLALLPARDYTPLENSAIALAKGHLASRQKQWRTAAALFERVDVASLYPPQAENLRQLRAEAAVALDAENAKRQHP
ncbi:MAG TPA: hypothetical protein VMF06_14770 [Candidatus Limnocylindria bacterium]|nr:hypothetical protein [Candidatus Limnocylindria bacterium]